MKTSAARKTEMFATHGINHAKTDEQLQDEFDQLVVLASQGDGRAIGAIAIANGPTLLKEARAALGDFDQDAEDVLQDFFLCLLEGVLRFEPAHGRAMPWMCRMVRAIAEQRYVEGGRDWGIDTEPE